MKVNRSAHSLKVMTDLAADDSVKMAGRRKQASRAPGSVPDEHMTE